MGSYVPRPGVLTAAQWTGDNEAEMHTAVDTVTAPEYWGTQFSVDGEGNGFVQAYSEELRPVAIGQWVLRGGYEGAAVMDDEAFTAGYQPGTGYVATP
jgi:hypothetical protein